MFQECANQQRILQQAIDWALQEAEFPRRLRQDISQTRHCHPVNRAYFHRGSLWNRLHFVRKL